MLHNAEKDTTDKGNLGEAKGKKSTRRKES
jgi:hypothetical protein